MQEALAGTGVVRSGGSTNVLPVPPRDHLLRAWRLHFQDVRHCLWSGFCPGPGCWAIPWGAPGPDGHVVVCHSNMNGGGRYELLVAEMPRGAGPPPAAVALRC